MITLSQTQWRVLRFVEKFWAEHDYAPTLEEISVAVGFKSRSSVAYQIGQLQQRGLIARDPLLARTIRLARHVDGSDARSNSVAQ